MAWVYKVLLVQVKAANATHWPLNTTRQGHLTVEGHLTVDRLGEPWPLHVCVHDYSMCA